jgi:hypothetical protein
VAAASSTLADLLNQREVVPCAANNHGCDTT